MYKRSSFLWHSMSAGILLLSSHAVLADISGKVFRDFNANGTFDTGASFNEVGMAGVTVKAFDAAGAEKASVTSGADGSYTLNGLTAGADYRVEFLWAESWLKPGSAGGTSVQFAKDGATDVKLAVQNPAQYCQADPYIAIPEYLNGDPLGNGTSGEKQAIVAFGSQWAGNAGDTAPLYEKLAIGKNVGAVGGLAYQPANATLFMAAVAKRHVGFGPNGAGAIYKLGMNPTNGKALAAPELFVDLAALGITSGTLDRSGGALSINAAEPNRDPNAFDAVGKVSLGDIEVSDDQKTLWAVNLADRKLYGMSANTAPTTAADLQAFDLVNAFSDLGHTCVDGEFRPWALKAHNGLVYVGGICTAENVTETAQAAFGAAADIDNQANRDKLHAYILALDPSKGTFADVYDFPLNYSRSEVTPNIPAEWRPWIKTWDQIHDPEPGAGTYSQTMYPQPMLTDIEFDDDGKTLILGLLDRAGHQLGNANSSPVEGDTNVYEGVTAGDILRVCPDTNGKLALESNGSCGGKTTAGAGTGEGPNNGEYYFAENYGSPGHAEIALGGLARIYGLGKTISNGFDVGEDYRSGGTLWLNDSTGAKDSAYVIFDRDDDGSSNGVVEPRTPATFGKAAGLGDMEVLCNPAPVEVGNRVWRDTDEDGIQDADEPGIDGVDVVLTCGTDTATVKTANGGQFLFSNKTNGTFMGAGESCKITVASEQTPLDGLSVTAQNADTATDNHPLTDVRDSDATTTGEIAFTVGGAGENNHALDVGYKSAPVVDAWCPAGTTQNFLVNGSFEVGSADEGAPSWTGNNNISVSSGITPKPHGSQFAFTWTPETFYQDADISGVATGHTVKLSYYSGSHQPSDQAVSVQYLTAKGGTVIGTATVLAVTHDVDDDSQLAQQELILGAKPEGANAVRVSVYGGSVDFIKVDAMCLYEGAEPAAVCDKPIDPLLAVQNLEVNQTKPMLSSTLDDAAILGGERDMKLESLQGVDAYISTFYVGDDGAGKGIIDWTNGSGDFSKATIVWDGNDNDADTLNPNGLGGVDLSSGDAFKTLVNFVDVERFKITLRVYSGAANVSESVFAYDNTQTGTTSNIPVAFSLAPVTGGGADLTKVGAVEMIFEPIDLAPTANGIDMNLGNFTAPCPVVSEKTDLSLSKSVNKPSAKRGETVVYTLTVTNESDVAATGVTVADKLPDGVVFVSHDGAAAGVYNAGTGEWAVGELLPGVANAKTLNITVTVK